MELPDDVVEQKGRFEKRIEKGKIRIDYNWRKDKTLCNESIYFGHFEKSIWINGSGNNRSIIVWVPYIVKDLHDGTCDLSSVALGYRVIFNEMENTTSFYCVSKTYPEDLKCQDEILLNPDSSVKEVITHPYKCTKYCGDFVPLPDNVEYLVNLDKTVVHEKPSKSSKKLAELNRNDRVNVIEDSAKIETILPHTATRAKIKTTEGIEGYIFGAYIRTKDEVDYEGIKEKARE